MRSANNTTSYGDWYKVAYTSDIPSSLKNPNSLTIQTDGTSLGSYDGSAVKTWNITYSNVGAASSGHTHSISLAMTTASSSIALDYNNNYKLTAGGSSTIFKMPTNLGKVILTKENTTLSKGVHAVLVSTSKQEVVITLPNLGTDETYDGYAVLVKRHGTHLLTVKAGGSNGILYQEG